MEWQLVIDPPMQFVTEAGFHKSQTCRAFAPRAAQNMTFDAATGLAMLTPSFMLPETLRSEAMRFTSWELSGDLWMELQRGHGVRESPPYERGGLFTIGMRKPVGTSRLSISLPTVTRNWPIPAGARVDVSFWVAKSKALLAEDQGLWMFVEPRSDPASLVENYFGVSWDNVLVAVRKDRRVEVYRCERGTLPGLEAWTLIASGGLSPSLSPTPEAFSLALIPIPGRGLSVTFTGFRHLNSLSGRDTAKLGSVSFVAPLSSTSVSDGGYRMLFASPVYVRANPFTPFDFAAAFVTYPSSGYMTDAAFALPYPPTVDPEESVALGYVAAAGAAAVTSSVEVMDGPGETPWVPGAAEASCKLSIATSDARYTSFVHSYRASWPSMTSTRSPGSITIGGNGILSLSVSDDVDGRSSGTASVLVEKNSTAMLKVKRPDFVYRLQNRESGGETWSDWCIGIGRATEITAVGSPAGQYYRAELQLDDMHSRLSELHVTTEGGFDGLTLATCINRLLTSAGFAPISESAFPLALRTTSIPTPQGDERWKYGPTVGQSGLELLEVVLRHAEAKSTRYRLRFTASGWVCEAVPFGATPNYVYMRAGEVAGSPWAREVKVSKLPPEANVLVVQGVTTSAENASRQVVYVVNTASITNPGSDDYLGRQRIGFVFLPEAQTYAQLQYWARQFEAEAMHAVTRMELDQPGGWTDSAWLSPGTLVKLLDAELEEPFPGGVYVMRRTVTAHGPKERVDVRYTLSSLRSDRMGAVS